MTSLSHDPFRFPFFPHGKFIAHVEPSGEGQALVFPNLICRLLTQGRFPAFSGLFINCFLLEFNI